MGKKEYFYLTLLFISVNCCTAKHEVTLDAILKDDLSNIELTLYSNKRFRISSNNMFGSENFEGLYKKRNNTIIFLNKPYSNGFIPEKVFIFEDKLIFNKNKIDTSFASFFKIRKNNFN